MIRAAVHLAERFDLPDMLSNAAIALLVGRTNRVLQASGPGATAQFARDMQGFAVAEHAEAANAQHYEVPAAFFQNVLGPHMKYSSCHYGAARNLAEAEAEALVLTAAHAALEPGQRILELGCGWGSLSLFMAERFRDARILAVSNSRSQRAHIMEQARRLGLGNVEVVAADINRFDPGERFDRIVSVEMFEHLSNWAAILRRARGWLEPDGRLFLHVFAHERTPYRFDHGNKADFIARHFFTGGIMPSHALIGEFANSFGVEAEWRWGGEHYARTARDWLANYDKNRGAIAEVLQDVYGRDAAIWRRRWRLFFLATAGLFGHESGQPWGVSHYRLKPT